MHLKVFMCYTLSVHEEEMVVFLILMSSGFLYRVALINYIQATKQLFSNFKLSVVLST